MSQEPRLCGRLTTSRQPCRNLLSGAGRLACDAHETAEDAAYRRGFDDGYRRFHRDFDEKAREWALKQRGYEISTAERRLAEIHRVLKDAFPDLSADRGDRTT
jgi:hypothetical protein